MAAACVVPNDAKPALQCRVNVLLVLTACFSPTGFLSYMHVADSAVGLGAGHDAWWNDAAHGHADGDAAILETTDGGALPTAVWLPVTSVERSPGPSLSPSLLVSEGCDAGRCNILLAVPSKTNVWSDRGFQLPLLASLRALRVLSGVPRLRGVD